MEFIEEPILLIQMYQPEAYRKGTFHGKTYELIGQDDVKNFVGRDQDGKVWYLERESGNVLYLAASAEILVQELKLYDKYCTDYELEAPSAEKNMEHYADGLAEQLRELDENALTDDDSFWSLIVEQMETEQL